MLARERHDTDDENRRIRENPDSAIGELIGERYRITALVGRGGMAAVYRADDEELPRTVAIKLMWRGTTDPEELRRQRSEIEIFASLNHPGLVTLLDAGVDTTTSGERAYIVMELVDGTTLYEEMGGLGPHQVAIIGADVADALHYLHSKGIVHRDIKPANILLTPWHQPGRKFRSKLADLGIAKLKDGEPLTETGVVIGTANYLSPEQASGAGATPASDIYALGIVLLEAVTGTRAFEGTTAESLAARLVASPALPSSLDPDWASLLGWMTAREPSDRPNAAEVAAATRELASRANVTAETVFDEVRTVGSAVGNGAGEQPTLLYPVADTESRGRRNTIFGAVTALALVAGVIAAIVTLSPTPADPELPAPTYPAVEGVLGTHLEQLQESVGP